MSGGICSTLAHPPQGEGADPAIVEDGVKLGSQTGSRPLVAAGRRAFPYSI